MKVERRNFSNIKLYKPVKLGVMTKSAANVWEVVFEYSCAIVKNTTFY